MATQAIEQLAEAPEAGGAAPATKGNRSVLIMAIVGVVIGSAAGLFGLGPVLANRRSGAHAAPKAAEAPTASVTHAIENLVLNPAGSGGTHFLMVTASFQLKDGATENLMKEHEAEVRDRILALLGRKTVDELDIMQRDRIKKEVLDAVAPLFPPGTVLKLFFPQFVIQ
ncbi:MAG: flagellar basal body-associated FliL family protein [bacterium]